MNNKGFTIIEVLTVLVLISFCTIVAFSSMTSSMSLGKKEAYQLMKNNIVSSGYTYINECVQGMISCDFSFEEKNTFSANTLLESGYFKNLNSPIDGKDLGECLILKATKENGVTIVDILDNCYR